MYAITCQELARKLKRAVRISLFPLASDATTAIVADSTSSTILHTCFLPTATTLTTTTPPPPFYKNY